MAGTLTLNGSASGTTSITTMPTHAVGDVIFLFVTRNGSTTAPTKPTATGTVPNWVTRGSTTGTTAFLQVWSFVATATNHTSGTWTNATGINAFVYNSTGNTFVYGTATFGTGTGTTVTYPAATNAVSTHTAVWLNFGFTKATNSTIGSTVPSGTTLMVDNPTTGQEQAIWYKAGGANYTATAQVVGGTSAVWIAATLNLSIGNWASSNFIDQPTSGAMGAGMLTGFVAGNVGDNGTKTYPLGQTPGGWMPASANRWVGVCAQMANSSFSTYYGPTSVTIGGVAATIVWNTGTFVNSANTMGVFMANVPTGTTGNLVAVTVAAGATEWDVMAEFCFDNIDPTTITVKYANSAALPTWSVSAGDQVFAMTVYTGATAIEDSPFGHNSTLHEDVGFYKSGTTEVGSSGTFAYTSSSGTQTYAMASNWTKTSTPEYALVVTASPAGGGSITGVAAITEDDDTSTATAQVLIQASASISEASDIVSSSGQLLISANASISESADTVSSHGEFATIHADASITEDDDAVVSAATLLIKGSASLTEFGDTVSSSGVLPITANASISEAADTISSTGIGPANKANASITEADDTVVSASKLSIKADASIPEGDDTSTSTAGVLIKGTLAYTEDGDTAASTAQLLITANASITEAGDTLSSTAQSQRFATANITEANDTIVSTGAGTTLVNATGSACTVFVGDVTLKYGWKEFAVGNVMTMTAGHIDTISWVPEVPGTGTWTPVTTPNATWTPIVPGTAIWKPVDA